MYRYSALPGIGLADPIDFFAHRIKARARRADAGQKAYNSQKNHDPYAKMKSILKVIAQHQEHTGRKQAGKTKLAYPCQQRKILHDISRRPILSPIIQADKGLKIKNSDSIIIHERLRIYNVLFVKVKYKSNNLRNSQ